MATQMTGVCGLAVVLGACGAVAPADIAPEEFHVGGSLHGLWAGADGVTLRLESESINDRLMVSANGQFNFPRGLLPDSAYTVTIAANPGRHMCAIEAGASGSITHGDITTVSVVCKGPDVSIAFSDQSGWTFDPMQDTQSFTGSVVVQDVALTISGMGLTSASISGVAALIGTPSTPIALPLGTTMVPITVAAGSLSKTYQLAFDRGGSALAQAVYAKASNSGASDGFSGAIALSGDTLAVGAPSEASSATGINGNDGDNSAPNAGAVYVFVRRGSSWTQQAYLKAANAERDDSFGTAIALSGNTLAVGAPGEASASVAINTGAADNSAPAAGAVYVFVRNGATWAQQAYIKAPDTGADDKFGGAVALSGDTLAVGALGEDSAATTINGNMNDNTASSAGAAYVFVRSGVTWTHQAYLKASNAEANDLFGFSIALSGDTLAVGADNEASAATGIDGNPRDNTARGAGAVYVFVRNGATWTQQAYVKASNAGAGDFFGYCLALAGNTLAVGAYHEASAATGIDGNQGDNSASNAGAVYVFARNGTQWAQQAYIKAANVAAGDLFGASLALSTDTLAVGAYHEDSATMDPTNDAAPDSGAAYVFVRNGTSWSQKGFLKASNTDENDLFGWSVALSAGTLVVGALQEASCSRGVDPPDGQSDEGCASAGAVYLFR